MLSQRLAPCQRRALMVVQPSQTASRALSSTPPSSSSKSPLQRLKDYFTFMPGSSWYGNDPKKFRSPAPGSEAPNAPGTNSPRPVHVPGVENTDTLFNTQYYTRDTRRNKPSVLVLAKDLKVALPKVTDPGLSSPGRFNVNVMKYDPSGSRSAMTTNRKAVQESLVKLLPDHLPAAPYRRDPKVAQAMLDDAKRKGVPLAVGMPMKWTSPPMDGKW
jgi:hypothetical protein